MYMPFKSRLRELRKVSNLTQLQLGEMCGIDSTAITHFESGSRKPSFENIIKLSKALSVSSDFLLGMADSDKDSINVSGLIERDKKIVKDLVTIMISR